MKLYSIVQVGILCCLMTLLASCSGKNVVEDSSDKNVEKLGCVVLLPTRTSVAVKDMEYSDAELLEKGATYLDKLIAEELNESSVQRVISSSHLDRLSPEITGGTLGMLKTVGRELNCNAVLVTSVQEYKQREGGEYAVDSPASAAFEMRLVDVSNGSVMWSTNFSETQQSLLSNLFSFNKAQSRGFKWITVEDLVRQGVHERLTRSPYLF